MINNHVTHWGAYVAHMRAEHRRLSHCLRGVERQWEAVGLAPASSELFDHLLQELRALRAELARHFAEEEAGGCLEEAVSALPQLSREVARLEREHAELLEALDRLLLDMRAGARRGSPVRTCEHEFRRLAARLRGHEAAETRILESCSGMSLE